jgi:hypothetical protein
MEWIAWLKSCVVPALHWLEAHPGTASWLEAVGSIAAIFFVGLFALLQARRATSHEDLDRIRRAQGLALVLVPVLRGFKPKIEVAIIRESKLEPPDEVLHLLDQLYVLGVAGGFVLQMVATFRLTRGPKNPGMTMMGARDPLTIQWRRSDWPVLFGTAKMRSTHW